MSTWRPRDQWNFAVAWKYGVERRRSNRADPPRQNPAQQERTEEQLANIARGGYVLKDCVGQPQIIFIATGSEVELAVAAYEKLTAEGVKARGFHAVHRTRSTSRMRLYRESVPPKAVLRVAISKRVSLTTGSNTLST